MQSTFLDITILALLLGVFASFYRARHERRFRYWLAGWAFALLHFALLLWTPQTAEQTVWRDCLHYDLLLIVGLIFLLSFIDVRKTSARPIVFALSLLVPAIMMVHAILQFPHLPVLGRLFIAAGEGIAIYQAFRNIFLLKRSILAVLILVSSVAAAVMLVSSLHHIDWVPNELLTQLYGFDALLLWSAPHTRRAQGVITTSIGLLTWALVFPAGILADRFYPNVAILPLVWNIPKFFAAFGMILIIFEDELDRTERLRESYQLLFECQPLPMWVMDLKSLRFLKVNEAATVRYGYSAEQFLTMTADQIRPKEELEAFHAALEPENQALRYIPNMKHLTREGKLMDVDIYSHPIPFQEEPAQLVVAIDVTSRNAAEEHLRQSQKMESLGQLTGGVAHDFNNLLAVIMGNLELIRDGLAEGITSEALINQVLGSVDRGAELTQRLLVYARQQPLAPRTINIPRLIENMHPLLIGSLGVEIALKTEISEDLRNINVDGAQLERAILNLAVNARDAMPDGGTLEICGCNMKIRQPIPAISAEVPPGDYVVLSFHDTGTGMTHDVLRRVTEPFFTTKPVGQGTGLGMSMVYGFVQQSGGYIQMASKPGVGTTVRLYLPASSSAEAAGAASGASLSRKAIPKGTETVLVVEDEPAIRRAACMLLKSLGYKVMEAGDGPEAASCLNCGEQIDLLLSDVILPDGANGVKIAERARELHPSIAVLFFSGYTQNALKQDGRLKEGMHLLTKPFQLETLATTVRKVLDESQASAYTA